jgi:hypothetical protein
MADDIVADALGSLKSAGNANSTGNEPRIWVGSRAQGYQTGSGVTYSKVDMTISDLQNAVLAAAAQRSPDYTNIANKMYQGGFLSSEKYMQIPAYTAKAVETAANMYNAYSMAGGSEDFNSWLDGYVATAQPRAGAGGGGSGGYAGPRTTTSVTLTDEVSATALLDEFARANLGRSLEEGEVEKYLSKFRKAEMGAPQVTTTTPRGVSATTSVTETAASKEELLRQIIAKNPDFAEFQMDTTVMDMFADRINRGRVG